MLATVRTAAARRRDRSIVFTMWRQRAHPCIRVLWCHGSLSPLLFCTAPHGRDQRTDRQADRPLKF